MATATTTQLKLIESAGDAAPKRPRRPKGLYLQWEGNRIYKQRIPTPRLFEPVAALSHGDAASGNMIIEGDNLQVLASLKSRYAGHVQAIYIDPPYNLGKNDFRYSDKRFHDPDADAGDLAYVTNEDGGRHTKWLNFMAPRLYMMWQLLDDEQGVIFVSINDVELFRLGMLLNEIFDEKNWVGTIVWKGNTDNNPSRIAIEHEYILCYAKCKERLRTPWRDGRSAEKDLMLDAFARIKKAAKGDLARIQSEFLAFAKENKDGLGDMYRYRRVDERGPYAARRNMDNPGKPGQKYKVIHPVTKKACKMPTWGWRYPEDAMNDLIAEGRIIFGKDHNKIPELKVYLEGLEFPLRSTLELDARKGSNDLERLFGTRDAFKNPKPVDLIASLLGYAAPKDALILDAFAGSGTTAEAVLRLNAQDGGTRRFLLIEDGEGSDRYGRTLTPERVKRAIDKYEWDAGFTFFQTGKKLDREAIVSLERDALGNLICQADETGRGRGVVRLTGYQYVVGRNHRGEAICLVWNGNTDSEVTPAHLKKAAEEVTKAKLKRPFRIYGTVCRVGDTQSWRFCQIPDEILAQMHIEEDSSGERDED